MSILGCDCTAKAIVHSADCYSVDALVVVPHNVQAAQRPGRLKPSVSDTAMRSFSDLT